MSNDLTYMFLIMWAGDSDLCAKSKYLVFSISAFWGV